jgi:hypothetical protein
MWVKVHSKVKQKIGVLNGSPCMHVPLFKAKMAMKEKNDKTERLTNSILDKAKETPTIPNELIEFIYIA